MNSRLTRSGRGIPVGARAALGLAPIACATALVVAGGTSWAGSTGPTVRGSDGNCAVQIQIGATSATATIESGCQGGDYWFSSWVTPSGTYQAGAPQQLLAATDHAPWSVVLPTGQPCYYQVDFSQRQHPPGHAGGTTTLVASYVGRTATCSSGATTTTGSPTTVTSSTTVPAGPVTTIRIATATTVPLSLPTTPPTVAFASGSATTSTTATVSVAAGQSQPPQAPAPASVIPTAASPTRSAFGSLAFTGFELLMAVFVALVLVVAGVGIVRASRRGNLPDGSGSSGPTA